MGILEREKHLGEEGLRRRDAGQREVRRRPEEDFRKVAGEVEKVRNAIV